MRKVAFIPSGWSDVALNDGLFQPLCFSLMRDCLSEAGYEVHTIDRFNPDEKLHAVIHIDVPRPGDRRHLRWSVENAKKLVFLWEAPAVKPFNYKPQNLKGFDHVISWNGNFLRNFKGNRFLLPAFIDPLESPVPFAEKKMLVMVAGHKKYYHEQELYSERENAARFFGKHLGDRFDLYGRPRWDGRCHIGFGSMPSATQVIRAVRDSLDFLRSYRSYRGVAGDKRTTLSGYRFCICFENMRDIEGYVTEKIWDCFSARTVPIYLGASDITDLVPKDCFVDMRDFQGYGDLLTFMQDMTEEQYGRYLSAAEEFLKTDKALRWHHEQWGHDVGSLLVNFL